MRGREPTRWVLHSSISSVLGGLGLSAYAGANAVLDSIATARRPDGSASAGTRGTTPPRPRWPACPPRSSRRRARRRSSVCCARPWDLASSSRSVTSRPVSNPGCARSEVAKPASRRSTPPATEPRHAVRRAGIGDREQPRGDLGLPARARQGRRPRPLLRPRRPLACLPCRWRRRSATASRSRCRCSSSSRRRPSGVGGAGRAGRAHRRRGRRGRAAVRRDRDRRRGRAAPTRRDRHRRGPGDLAKASYREFYDDVSRRLAATGMGEASFFLNYGYVSQGERRRGPVRGARGGAQPQLDPAGPRARRVDTDLDGRGVLMSVAAAAAPRRSWPSSSVPRRAGVDLSPEAIAFCRNVPIARGVALRGRRRREPPLRRRIVRRGDQPRVVAHLPRHARLPRPGPPRPPTRRVVPAHRPAGRAALDGGAGHPRRRSGSPWSATATSRRMCWLRATRSPTNRTQAFGAASATIDNFLAVPGSPVYEQMASGAWEYRILRSRLG